MGRDWNTVCKLMLDKLQEDNRYNTKTAYEHITGRTYSPRVSAIFRAYCTKNKIDAELFS